MPKCASCGGPKAMEKPRPKCGGKWNDGPYATPHDRRRLRACSSCGNPTFNADLCRSCADDAAVDEPCPRLTDIACEPEPCWCRWPNAEYQA